MKDLLNDTNNKNVVYQAKIHWIAYVSPIFWSVILILFSIVISFFYYKIFDDEYQKFERWFSLILGLYILLKIFNNLATIIYLKFTKIYLTKKYITCETGILSKTIEDISLNKHEGISMHQSFLGRILKYGTLFISTGEINISYFIAEPTVLRQHILELKNNLD